MELKDEFGGGNAALIRSIKALLELDASGVLRPHGIGGHARTLLEAAAARLGNMIEPAIVHDVALALAQPAQDGLSIFRSDSSGDGWQDYNVRHVRGVTTTHFCAIRVVRRMKREIEDLPAFPLIERRLLAGNPVEV
ncbi:hypothetical protein [Burkholderia multivorans]|uniref:Uncharacterized protein n=1 Tax=Burkholderia multivorans TaxID=87883 RepID=A0A2S9MBF4_9BURK|nr:hypothetical protein [Burkholderia multivorans]MBU9525024.1 hypothetical protein [Burkholderia multivorans]MBU9537029.1 hypothetical protein [Burkholderia multivorans]MBU9635459.1 hypothetical protein [Burkholderia multivorans]PRF08636.1 hypothetical protein C6Q07_11080 [Burkholderia multivorans]PRF54664.1 hypothetical protein C6Q15_28285 [Burkholderia multivorans]